MLGSALQVIVRTRGAGSGCAGKGAGNGSVQKACEIAGRGKAKIKSRILGTVRSGEQPRG